MSSDHQKSKRQRRREYDKKYKPRNSTKILTLSPFYFRFKKEKTRKNYGVF